MILSQHSGFMAPNIRLYRQKDFLWGKQMFSPTIMKGRKHPQIKWVTNPFNSFCKNVITISKRVIHRPHGYFLISVIATLQDAVVHNSYEWSTECHVYWVSGFAVLRVGLCLEEDGVLYRWYATELTKLMSVRGWPYSFRLNLYKPAGWSWELCMVVMGSDLGFMSLVLGVVGSLVGLGGCDFFRSVVIWSLLGSGPRTTGSWAPFYWNLGRCLDGRGSIMWTASGSDSEVWSQSIRIYFG